MYCCDCKGTFEESEAIEMWEYDDPRDEDSKSYYAACPFCGSARIESSEECEKCGKEKGVGEFKGGLCNCCYEETINEFKDTFSRAEINAIKWAFENDSEVFNG